MFRPDVLYTYYRLCISFKGFNFYCQQLGFSLLLLLYCHLQLYLFKILIPYCMTHFHAVISSRSAQKFQAVKVDLCFIECETPCLKILAKRLIVSFIIGYLFGCIYFLNHLIKFLKEIMEVSSISSSVYIANALCQSLLVKA